MGFWDGSDISWTIYKCSASRSRQCSAPQIQALHLTIMRVIKCLYVCSSWCTTNKTFNSLLTRTEKFCKSFLLQCLNHYDWLFIDCWTGHFVLFCIVVYYSINPAYRLQHKINHYYFITLLFRGRGGSYIHRAERCGHREDSQWTNMMRFVRTESAHSKSTEGKPLWNHCDTIMISI